MSEFTDSYLSLLIKQYYDQPKASAEVEKIAAAYEFVYSVLKQFEVEFDVDTATGDRLDKIGKIVGVPRNVPFVIAKIRFGFETSDDARGFDDLFAEEVESAPFRDLFEFPYTTQQLDDFDYRFFIKAKIASNQASAYLFNDEYLTIQEVVQITFANQAYVIDNKDMTLTLYVSSSFDDERLRTVQRLNLLPKPQGVRYKFVVLADPDSFGFESDPNAKGFGDINDETLGGTFSRILI